MCGSIKKSAKALDLHHVWPGLYDTLEMERFVLLCGTCHDFIEHMGMRWPTKTVPNEDKMLVWLDRFIPRNVRTIDKYMGKVQKDS